MQYKNKFFGIVVAGVNSPATVFTGKLFWLDKDGLISSGPSINLVLFNTLFRFVWFTDIERG